MTPPRTRCVRAVPALLALALIIPACGRGDIWFARVEADAGAEASADPEPGECPATTSTCVPTSSDWGGPTLLWHGPHDVPFFSDAGGPPACPYDGVPGGFRGGIGLVAPTDCIPCTCGPSSGSCELPSLMTAHDVTCQNLGQPHKDIPFHAASGWKGGCDNMDPIAAGSGIQSLSIDPVTVKQESCAVGPPVPARKLADPYWTTDAFECHVEGYWECDGDPVRRCIPNHRPEGFEVCLTHPDEIDPKYCPSPFTVHHFFYGGWKDNRGCSDCSCGPPAGSQCESLVSVYTDNACKTVQDTGKVTSDPNFCVNILPPGTALMSKSATPPTYTPGICAPSGGVPSGGAAVEILPTTFCCLP